MVAALLVLTSCSATYRNHGYMPPEEDLQNVIVGVDTRDTVASAVGRPGVSGILDDSGWYYVRSRYRNFAWRAPEEIDREVLAISFDDTGVVTNIETFGLERGRVVRLSRRVTTPNTQGVGFLRQAFGNLGRITAGDFLGDDN
ncbi:outer membrane protein assembly factor BamE [Ovoidimarina sediminis]|uniref:outer membrane protein assembly factor BamE n=1 Tax=Ovoidimarina sediminis TaxID=3079856 RepID=UPI002911139D|nr:outer membrane protein assembly factor BamE [Rhodophyticola sp. MJ-SS7]MDU8946083.1 outer membrane protein assembly factor BamE [Rhodophyticola sp. MJ-SS7]